MFSLKKVIYRGWLAATRRARQESFFRQLRAQLAFAGTGEGQGDGGFQKTGWKPGCAGVFHPLHRRRHARGARLHKKKFQVIQEGFDELKRLVVPRAGREEAEKRLSGKKAMLEGLVTKVMGEGCMLEVLLVEEIPRTPSGKYCWTKVHMNARNN